KEVSETIFGDNSSSSNNNSDEMGKQHSKDPFKIYDILKKQTGGETREVSSSLSHPPGFTSEVSVIRKENDQDAEEFSSEAVGNSGGILCVWEANIFKKDYATISDNFVAIYRTWLPINSKILFMAIYAPHQSCCKRALW
nr:RNA-directed DNA polymerase, eukaryota [Tanacetum cinerariifolium]